MAEGHLETHGHREALETMEKCCSDQIPQQQDASSDHGSNSSQNSTVSQWEGGVH